MGKKTGGKMIQVTSTEHVVSQESGLSLKMCVKVVSTVLCSIRTSCGVQLWSDVSSVDFTATLSEYSPNTRGRCRVR